MVLLQPRFSLGLTVGGYASRKEPINFNTEVRKLVTGNPPLSFGWLAFYACELQPCLLLFYPRSIPKTCGLSKIQTKDVDCETLSRRAALPQYAWTRTCKYGPWLLSKSNHYFRPTVYIWNRDTNTFFGVAAELLNSWYAMVPKVLSCFIFSLCFFFVLSRFRKNRRQIPWKFSHLGFDLGEQWTFAC